MVPLSRSTLHALADIRLVEAQKLLSAGNFAGAYYLAGYGAELAFKACVARQFRADEIPDWAMAPIKSHRLDSLVRFAGLQVERDERRRSSAEFDRNWEIVEAWNVDARYRMDLTQESAVALVEALSDPAEGVLTWIKTRW